MLEQITKSITRWYLEINGERTKFREKKLAIALGKPLLECGHDVKLIEEYDMFGKAPSDSKMKKIDHQEFDRTILLKYD